MRYLLDTCVISELTKNPPDRHVLGWLKLRQSQDLFLSAISWAELQRGVARLPESKRKVELTSWLTQIQIGFEGRILPFDRQVAETWGHMTAAAEAQGRTVSAFDSIIAATAGTHGCTLVTRNIRDFSETGIAILNPWQLD